VSEMLNVASGIIFFVMASHICGYYVKYTLQIIQNYIDLVYGSFLTHTVVVGGTINYFQKYNNHILTIF